MGLQAYPRRAAGFDVAALVRLGPLLSSVKQQLNEVKELQAEVLASMDDGAAYEPDTTIVRPPDMQGLETAVGQWFSTDRLTVDLLARKPQAAQARVPRVRDAEGALDLQGVMGVLPVLSERRAEYEVKRKARQSELEAAEPGKKRVRGETRLPPPLPPRPRPAAPGSRPAAKHVDEYMRHDQMAPLAGELPRALQEPWGGKVEAELEPEPAPRERTPPPSPPRVDLSPPPDEPDAFSPSPPHEPRHTYSPPPPISLPPPPPPPPPAPPFDWQRAPAPPQPPMVEDPRFLPPPALAPASLPVDPRRRLDPRRRPQTPTEPQPPPAQAPPQPAGQERACARPESVRYGHVMRHPVLPLQCPPRAPPLGGRTWRRVLPPTLSSLRPCRRHRSPPGPWIREGRG
jgi:hypothetical protein